MSNDNLPTRDEVFQNLTKNPNFMEGLAHAMAGVRLMSEILATQVDLTPAEAARFLLDTTPLKEVLIRHVEENSGT